MINVIFIDDEYAEKESSLKKIWENKLLKEGIATHVEVYSSPLKAKEDIGTFALNTVIVLDLKMPEMAGEEFLGKVRSAGLHMPIIIYSANQASSNSKLTEMIQNNIFSYVNKGEAKELAKAILNAFSSIKDNIPLELSEALDEYIKKDPRRGDAIIASKDGIKTSLKNIKEEINKRSQIGIDYQKALYKLSFERLVEDGKDK